MKQILIKLAALGLLFSVVSTYACDTCDCKYKPGESINVHDVEGKHFIPAYPDVNEDGKKRSGVPVISEKSKDEKMNAGDHDGDVGAVPPAP